MEISRKQKGRARPDWPEYGGDGGKREEATLSVAATSPPISEELDEQQKLTSRRKALERQKDLDEEKAILAMNSDIVQAKLKEQQRMDVKEKLAKQVTDIKTKGRRNDVYLHDSNLFNKVEYQLAQKGLMEREKRQIQNEIDKTLKQADDEYMRKTIKGEKIASTLKDIYTDKQVKHPSLI